MANPIEAIRHSFHVVEERTKSPQRDYIGSVLSRTFGIDGYQRFYQSYTIDEHSNQYDRLNQRASSVVAGLLQITWPALSDYLVRGVNMARGDEKFYSAARLFGEATSAVATEMASISILAPAIVHDPISFVGYKVGYNLAAHVGGDALATGFTRIKNFRPPASATLAA